MDQAAVTDYILALDHADRLEADGDSYFYYNPGDVDPPDRRFPFATLVTSNRHDQASDLDRADVFRLNVGVSKETFASLALDAAPDFTALDQLLPHPVYGSMSWVSVLNPSDATFELMKPLLAEAHARAAKRCAH